MVFHHLNCVSSFHFLFSFLQLKKYATFFFYISDIFLSLWREKKTHKELSIRMKRRTICMKHKKKKYSMTKSRPFSWYSKELVWRRKKKVWWQTEEQKKNYIIYFIITTRGFERPCWYWFAPFKLIYKHFDWITIIPDFHVFFLSSSFAFDIAFPLYSLSPSIPFFLVAIWLCIIRKWFVHRQSYRILITSSTHECR